jgi:uncharacterized membrane protein
MQEWLIRISQVIVLVIDAMALVVIAFGTVQAFVATLAATFSPGPGPVAGHDRRDIWLRYARWLVAGLTFQLAADIVESSITTSWEAVGRLGAIALIRTFLNYFLERDLEEVRKRQREKAEGSPALHQEN